jgi:hypothetical protein
MSQNGCMRSRATAGRVDLDRNIRRQYPSIPAIDKCLSGLTKRVPGAVGVYGVAVGRTPFTVFLQFR